MKKAMDELSHIQATKQVNDALNQRNGPSVTTIHDTPVNSPVLVWREGNTGRSGKWTGPFPLIEIQGETCRVQLPSGLTDFRSTTVKPYHQTEPDDLGLSENPESPPENSVNPVNNKNPEKGTEPTQVNNNPGNPNQEEILGNELITEPEDLPRRNPGRN
jgi:hypothetical protein